MGRHGRASQDVHTVIGFLGQCRVITVKLRGERPVPHKLGKEITSIRRRLSNAAVKVANNGLLGEISKVGEDIGIPAKTRELHRQKEALMRYQKEADWAVKITEQEIIERYVLDLVSCFESVIMDNIRKLQVMIDRMH